MVVVVSDSLSHWHTPMVWHGVPSLRSECRRESEHRRNRQSCCSSGSAVVLDGIFAHANGSATKQADAVVPRPVRRCGHADTPLGSKEFVYPRKTTSLQCARQLRVVVPSPRSSATPSSVQVVLEGFATERPTSGSGRRKRRPPVGGCHQGCLRLSTSSASRRRRCRIARQSRFRRRRFDGIRPHGR